MCLRSDFRPTRIRGVVGQKWRTSGYHCLGYVSMRVDARDFGGAGSGAYLVHHVLERVGAIYGEANENEVGFRVGEGSEAVVFFLACCVPESELDAFAAGLVLGLCDVVFEDCGYVFLTPLCQPLDPECWYLSVCSTHFWEDALAIAYQQACLATATIAHYNELFRV